MDGNLDDSANAAELFDVSAAKKEARGSLTQHAPVTRGRTFELALWDARATKPCRSHTKRRSISNSYGLILIVSLQASVAEQSCDRLHQYFLTVKNRKTRRYKTRIATILRHAWTCATTF
jgi:hypothetical protein